MGTRSVTLAFRISQAEWATVDEQAERCGLSNSEFARRAVVGATRLDAAALAGARDEGRAEMYPAVRQLRQQLAQAQNSASSWREQSRILANQLTQSSDDLVSATKEVLAGDSDAKVKVATIWARLWRSRRLKLLPILGAAAEREFEQSVAALPMDETLVDTGVDFLQRLGWLTETLDPDAGDAYGSQATARADGPLEKTLERLAGDVQRHRDVIEQQAKTKSSSDLAARAAEPEWARGLVRWYSQ
jgi:hypothetical protein